MLKARQVALVIVLGIAFWFVALLAIRYSPGSFTHPVRGTVGFVTAIPIAWLSVRLTRRLARLSRDQLLPGISIACVIAMLLDAVGLRWWPSLYSGSDTTIRFASGWLLWGYALSLGITVVMVGGRVPVSAESPMTPAGCPSPPPRDS